MSCQGHCGKFFRIFVNGAGKMKNIMQMLMLLMALTILNLCGSSLALAVNTVQSFPDVTVTEGAIPGTATLTVTLAAPADSDLSFSVSAGSGTADGTDYDASAATLSIPTGSTSGATTIAIANDAVVEATETFVVTITPTAGVVAFGGAATDDNTATVTINNDDKYSITSFPSLSVNENGGSAILKVTLNQAVIVGDQVDFTVTTTDGTAVSVGPDVDYSAPASPGSIVSGDDHADITIPINDDSLVESAETFTVTFTPTSANVSTGPVPATVTINIQDKYTVTFGNQSLDEPVGAVAPMTFAPPAPTISPTIQDEHDGKTIQWTTTSGTATAGSDFVAANGSLTLSKPIGVSGSVVVDIKPDTDDEGDQSFTITPTSGGTLSPALFQFAGNTGTIKDNDNRIRPTWNAAFGAVTLMSGGTSIPITSGATVSLPDGQDAVITVSATHRIHSVAIDGSYYYLNGASSAPLAYVTASTVVAHKEITYTFTPSVAASSASSYHSIAVLFDPPIEMTASGAGTILHITGTTTHSAGVNLSATSGATTQVLADYGQNESFQFTKGAGTCVVDVIADGVSKGAFKGVNNNYDGDVYQFNAVTTNHTIEGVFDDATITVKLASMDGDPTRTAFIQSAASGSGWRAYRASDSAGTKLDAAPFKTGTNNQTFSIPGDIPTTPCDTQYILIEFLSVDGYVSPSQYVVNLGLGFKDQLVEGLYEPEAQILTVVSSNGNVTLSPEGAAAVGVQRYLFLRNTVVQLSASGTPPWMFSLWQGDIGSATAANPIINLTMDKDRTVEAVFVKPCQDADGDGYTVGTGGTSCAATTVDCNDTSSSIYPGATEVCGDGIDQNCDGSDLTCTGDYADNDGDGYTENQGDCNDASVAIAPGLYDNPATSIDEDCYDGPKEKGLEETCVAASDVPANAAVKPAPSLIMFLLDDSGSMDWEFMTSASNQLFDNKYYVYNYNYISRAYDDVALTTAQRRKWQSQLTSYNRIYFNPSVTYAPWPMWEDVIGAANVRSHEKAYNPTLATFPDIAYAAGYTHADMDFPRTNTYDPSSTYSAMYHPGDASGSRSNYEMALNAEFLSVKAAGQQVVVTRDASSSEGSTYADAVGVSTDGTLEQSQGHPYTWFSAATKPLYIFDNHDGSTVYSESGTWYDSGGEVKYEWLGLDNDRYTDGADRSAYWRLNLTTAGSYYVYAWVDEYGTRDNNALYTIYYTDAGALKSVSVRKDQSPTNTTTSPANGARWIRLTNAPLPFVAQAATSATVSIRNAHYYTFNDLDGDGVQDTGEDVYLVNIPGTGYAEGSYSLEFYKVNDINNNSSVEDGELIPVAFADVPAKVKPVRRDVAGNVITDPAKLAYMVRQDFADWFSFYRRRILTAKAAVGLTVADMKEVELGIHTINRTYSKPLVLMSTADGTKKVTYLTTIYNIRPDGSTPLRRGLYEVGKYFEEGATSDYTYLKTATGLCTGDTSVFWDANSDVDANTCDDSGGECQRAYVIAMTDGYYNESFSSVGDVDTASPTVVFRDSIGKTLADVAMNFYDTDLDSVLGNNVAAKGFDDNARQHLVTYTVAFGVSGYYKPELFPDCLPSCDTPGESGCPSLSSLSKLAYSDYTGGVGAVDGKFAGKCPTWWGDDPNTSGESPKRIDDLYHAAVNSRGEFLNAADPAELVAAMQTIKDLIADQTGTASSLAINANKIEEDTLLFQTTYDSSDWNGDTQAKCLDNTGVVAACSRVSCESTCNTTYETCDAACASSDATCKTACKTSLKTCTASCTGQTCDEAHATCSTACSTASCKTACNATRDACLLSPPEIKWSAAKIISPRTADSRQIITFNKVAADGVPFRWDDLTTDMKSQLLGKSQILDYLRGDSTYERKNDTAGLFNFRNRSSKLGDFINAEPYHYANTTLGIDWVFVGGNDGMLHVFDSNTGEEVFAYVPQMVFSKLYHLKEETYNDNHKFFADGYVTVKDLGGSVVLVGGLGKGGKGFFALDLTKAAAYKNDVEDNADEIVLWEYSAETFATQADIVNNLGYSFSRPQIVASNDVTANWVLVFGNGYESPSGKAVLFTVGLDNLGGIRWTKIIDTNTGNNTTGSDCNGLSTPALVLPQGDAANDFAYAGDLLGNLWKFNLSDTDRNNWEIYFKETSTGDKKPFFQAKSDAGYRQPITMQPVITLSCVTDTAGYMVLFGTGRILNPDVDFLDQSVQTVYGLWDWSAAWKAAGDATPEDTYLGVLGTETTAIKSSCQTVCGNALGSVTVPGSCIYECGGDSECETECNTDYASCYSNCGAVRPLSNMTHVVGSSSAPYVTLLRQTQIWAGGINYNDDGTVKETVYGATDFDVYDQIARVLSANLIDWYKPSQSVAFGASGKKTAKHVGWYFDLPANGERIVRDMTVVSGKLVFTSTIPSDSPCESGGTSYHWSVSACSGSRSGNTFFDLNADELFDSSDYINIGTAANPLWVAVSAIGVEGISPAVNVVDVAKSAFERMYYPGHSDPVDAKSPLMYWRDLDWK